MLSISRFKALIILCLFVGLAGCMTGCTKNAEPAKVTFTIPTTSGKIVSQSATATTSSVDSDESATWGLSAATSLTELSCFALFIGGDELSMKVNSIDTSAGETIRFGPFVGLVTRGQPVTVDITSGVRYFTLIGSKLATGASCEKLPELTNAQYSAPVVIARVRANIVPGENNLTIDAVLSSVRLTNLQLGATGGTGTRGLYLGSGADGDITVSSLANLSTAMNQANTRKLMTTVRLTNRTLTLTPGEFTLRLESMLDGTHFGVGDEIMVYVAGEGNQGGTNSCGGQLFAGFRLEGRVTEAATTISTHSTMKAKIFDPRFATIPNTALAAAGVSGTDFCRVVVTRVPNIKNLTLTSTGSMSTDPFGSLNATNNTGGIIAMRVAGNLTAQGTNSIDAGGIGYQQMGASSGRGESFLGASASTTSALGNGGGGGDATYGAGGGGHGGSGLPGQSSIFVANAASAGGTVGDEYGCGVLDTSKRCLFGKMFFGGAGGHATTGTGTYGHGGGLIAIFANVVDVASGATLVIKSNGDNGDSLNAGGAGGSILLRALVLKGQGTLMLKTMGGTGDTTNTKYGGGGGGRIHVDVINTCDLDTAAQVYYTGGLSGPSAGTPRTGLPGTFYKTGPATAQTSCLLP